jgi:hypothetical protein
MGGAYLVQNFTPLKFIEASGGLVSYYNADGKRYQVHTFTTVGTNTFTILQAGSTQLNNIEYLIVGGGGAGGGSFSNTTTGGGGGAGGFLTGTTTLSPGQYSIVVGAGGTGRYGSESFVLANNGENSSAFNLTAIGGGAGGSWEGSDSDNRYARSGGSGGGQSDTSNANRRNGGAGTPGQGFAGGSGPAYAGGTQMGAGGGGGAGGVGGNGTGNANGGNGGLGLTSSITGASVTYAAGGGGGVGSGGSGGSGTTNVSGSGGLYGQNGQSAPANRGGGGGGGGGTPTSGGNQTGGNGGSGIVIVKYEIPFTELTVPQDNLLLHLNSDNYSGSGTVWADESGNSNDVTLSTTMASNYDGTFFNLSDAGFTGPGNLLTQNTASTVIYIMSTTDTQALFLDETSSTGYFLGAYSSSNKEYYGQIVGTPDYRQNLVSQSNIYDNVRTGNMMMIEFKNVVPQTTWNSTNFNNYSGFTFGSGQLGAILIYNRVLTEEESQQVYDYYSEKGWI